MKVSHAAGSALLIAGAICGSAAFAETLEEAWAQAISHDPLLAAASEESELARANERAARGARWPSLEANAGYTRLNGSPSLDVTLPNGSSLQSGPIFRDDQYLSGSVQMSLPLYAGGQISSAIDAAHDTAAGAAEIERATVSNLKLAVAESYVAVLRARHALEAATSSVQSLAAHLNDVQSLLDSDSVPKSDLLAARVALSNAEQRRVRADNALEMALASYNRPLGQPLDRSPQLDERLAVDSSRHAQPVEMLVHQALDARAELKALLAQADSLSSQARAENGKRLPQLALTGSYTHFDNQILDRQNLGMIGIGITWRVFDGGQVRNRAAALRSASRAQQNRLEDLRTQIALEVRRAWLGVQDAHSRLGASHEAVKEAEENLRMSRELYGVSLATNTQVLNAVSLKTEAVNNRDDAVLDEALAKLQLARAVGDL